MRVSRAVYAIVLRAEHGDGIAGLRWLLKFSLRKFGLKCLDARQIGGAP